MSDENKNLEVQEIKEEKNVSVNQKNLKNS